MFVLEIIITVSISLVPEINDIVMVRNSETEESGFGQIWSFI